MVTTIAGVTGERVDEAVLAQLAVDLGAENATAICRLFLENAATEVHAVGLALAAGDPAAAARTAHRLRSSSGFVGATGMAALCADIEAGHAVGDALAAELERTTADLNRSVERLAAL